MKLQLHITGSKLETNIKIKNSTNVMQKPLGALWTSSLTEDRSGSAWTEWCEIEGFNIPKSGIWKGMLLTPSKGAHIYTVDSLEDIEELYEYFPLQSSNWSAIDFEKLAQSFDAIHLTKSGLRASAPFFGKHGLYGWECESVCWLNPAFKVTGLHSTPVKQGLLF